eukprot:750196-Hanusia_phi.AAC.5
MSWQGRGSVFVKQERQSLANKLGSGLGQRRGRETRIKKDRNRENTARRRRRNEKSRKSKVEGRKSHISNNGLPLSMKNKHGLSLDEVESDLQRAVWNASKNRVLSLPPSEACVSKTAAAKSKKRRRVVFRDEIELTSNHAIPSNKDTEENRAVRVKVDSRQDDNGPAGPKESKRFDLVTDLFGIQLLGPMGWKLPNFGASDDAARQSNKENNENESLSSKIPSEASWRDGGGCTTSHMMVDDEEHFVGRIINSSHLLSDLQVSTNTPVPKKRYGKGTIAELQLDETGHEPQESSPSTSMPHRGWRVKKRQLTPRQRGPQIEESSPSRGHIPFSLTPETMSIW